MHKPYNPGEHRVQCDICGRTRRNTEVRPQWDSTIACTDTCWSPKHPSLFPVPVINDGLPVSNARPRATVDTNPRVHVGGTTSWDDPTLIWESPDWIWSDDNTVVSFDSLIARNPSLDPGS